MFLQYYNLREQPFGVTPDPRYFYPGAAHREALASLVYSFESELGFTSLIAEPGLGKTTLLHCLLEQFGPTTRTAFVFETQCDSRELLRHILCDLEKDPSDTDMNAMFRTFRDLLADEARAGRRVLLVIDEAQNLGQRALETIRLLSNFETSRAKLVHIVLSGQPQMAQSLARPELAQLRQRITTVARLRPFSTKEIGEYVRHRLQVAGYNGPPIFTPEALAIVKQRSHGIPREINRICFNALSLGFALERKLVDGDTVGEAAADLDLGAVLAANDRTIAAPNHREAIPSRDTTHEIPRGPTGPPARSRKPTPISAPVSNRQPNQPPTVAEWPDRPSQAAMDAGALTHGSTALRPRAQPAIIPMPAAPGAAKPRPVPSKHATTATIRRESNTLDAGDKHSARLIVAGAVLLVAMAAGIGLLAARSRLTSSAPAPSISTTQQRAASQASTVVDQRQQSPVPAVKTNASEAQSSSRRTQSTVASGPNHDVGTAETGRNRPVLELVPDQGTRSPGSGDTAAVMEPPAMAATGNNGLPSLPEPNVTAPVSGPLTIEEGSASGSTSAHAESISPLRLISRVNPKYPEAARSVGIQGTVVLSAHVGKDGSVTALRPIRGNALLVQAAMDAVRRWMYTPSMLDGHPVEADTVVTVNFSR